MNKNKEFEAALQRFMGASVDICQEAADIRVTDLRSITLSR